ncbi:MAG: hypothetical protein HZB77_11045 [Chloroflexi bacterium]|nr:hypothetical protein [Chloroflexota bacterium]
MNTLKITLIVITVVALTLVGAGIVAAQAPTPFAPRGGGYGMMGGNGYGTMGGNGYGMMGNFTQNGDTAWMNTMHQWTLTNGGMHNVVWQGLADALKIKPEDLSAELAKGKTLTQIAEAKGISQKQLTTALEASMKVGLDKAVKDGAVSKEQADWMLTNMAGNYELMITQMGSGVGAGAGGCHGTTPTKPGA